MVKRIILFSILLLAFGFSVSFGVTKKISGTTNVEDAEIYLWEYPSNFGGTNYLIVSHLWGSEPSNEEKTLIRVKNVASELGAGATNITAVCSLYSSGTDTPLDTIYAYRVFKPWREGTSDAWPCTVTAGGVTYDDWDCIDYEWGTAGCDNASDAGSDNSGDGTDYDRKVTPEGAGVVITQGWQYKWYSWSISTELATGWYNGTIDENGIILIGRIEDSYTHFRSTEHATASQRPFFVFTYDQTEQDTFALLRIKDDWRFLPSFIMDWRFQDSVQVAQVQKIFNAGAIDTIYINGVVQNIYK